MAFTVTGKLFVALRLCALTAYTFVSVTTVVKVYTPGTCPTVGVHRITPLLSIVDPVGPVSTYPSGLTGISLSLAVLVTVKLCVPTSVRLLCTGKVGAVFTSFTTTVKLFVALKLPSLTMVVNTFVLGPCASVGVHVITPFVLMLAFVATPPVSSFVTVSVYVSDNA